MRHLGGPYGVLMASFAAWAVLEIWVFARDARRVEGRSADRGTLPGVILAVAAGVWAGFWAASALPWAAMGLARVPLFWTGVVMMWAGIGLRLWAVLTLGAFFRVTVVVQDQHQLVTAGPYRVLRHPGYAGSILTLVGLGLGLGNWVSFGAIAAACALGYGWRIAAEEAALRGRFGEAHAAWRKTTWAVIPWVW